MVDSKMTNDPDSPITLLLTEAKALISDKKHWCKSSAARDINGKKIDVLSANAVCFCSYGAITRVTTRRKGFDQAFSYNVSVEATHILNDASYTLHNRHFVTYNDTQSTTHEDIMSVWDLAIKKSRQ